MEVAKIYEEAQTDASKFQSSAQGGFACAVREDYQTETSLNAAVHNGKQSAHNRTHTFII